MDIWEQLYKRAKREYHPKEVSPFIYAHHVVCSLEAENGEIYTGFCIDSSCGVMDPMCGTGCGVEYVCK